MLLWLTLGVVFLAVSVRASCPPTVVLGGCRCDNKTDDTRALQAIVNSCAAANLPVVVPANVTCLSQPLELPSHTHVSLSGTLKAGAKWTTGVPFVSATNAVNVSIAGEGTIDGSGKQWWTGSNKTPNRPKLVVFNNVSDVTFTGLTMKNAASFHFYFTGEHYRIVDVSVYSPPYTIAPNTDGIDIGGSDVYLSRVFVRNGDDSICLKGQAHDVVVEDSVVEQGNGLVVGTSSNIAVRNVTFRRCTANGTRYGAHVKAKDAQVGTVSDIVWEDIVVDNVWYAMSIDQYTQDPAVVQSPQSSVVVSNVTYSNFTVGPGGNVSHAGFFACQDVPGLRCTGINMNDVQLDSAANGCLVNGVYGKSTNTSPKSCVLGAPPPQPSM